MNCYLSRNYKGTQNAGNKAKTDIEKVLQGMGFKNVGLKQTTYKNKALHFLLTLLGVMKCPFGLHKDDCLVLQYPLKKYFTFVCRLAHLRRAKVIVVIHDLGSFRRKALSIEKEIKRLNHADYIIAHNDKMKQWLEEHGCQAGLGTLGIFDYLSDTQAAPAAHAEKPYSILYAGGLSPRKNAFLYEVGEYIHNFSFNLYGYGFEMSKAKEKEHFKYMGFVPSDQLIASAQGNFGLVWDGSSVDACTGDFGEYLQYNNPHKTSLYIRCELPVIIWKKAALAQFVEENGIGITIGSLKEIDEKLNLLSPEEYAAMKQNVCSVSRKLASGHYISEAIGKALKTF